MQELLFYLPVKCVMLLDDKSGLTVYAVQEMNVLLQTAHTATSLHLLVLATTMLATLESPVDSLHQVRIRSKQKQTNGCDLASVCTLLLL